MSLKAFIDEKNRVRSLMCVDLYDPKHINEREAQELFMQIDIAMNHEALYWGKDRTPEVVQAITTRYKAAWEELKAKGFVPKGVFYHMA